MIGQQCCLFMLVQYINFAQHVFMRMRIANNCVPIGMLGTTPTKILQYQLTLMLS